MKKNNTIITAIIGIVVGGWSIASWQVGKQIEAQLPTYSQYLQAELWKLIEESPDLPLQFDLVNYKRGIFSSTAQYNILKLPANNDQVLINVKIDHGPFPLNSLTNFSLRPKAASAHVEFVDSQYIKQIKAIATNGKTPFTVDIDIYDENNFTLDFNIAPINISQNKVNLNVKGVQLFTDISKNTDNSKLKFKIDNIDFKSDQVGFELADLKMDSTFILTNQNTVFPFAKQQTLNLNRLKTRGFQNAIGYPDINISKLNISSTGTPSGTPENQNFNVVSEFHLDDFSLGVYDLGSFSYKANINNLNSKATEALITALQKKMNNFSYGDDLEEIIINNLTNISEGHPTFSISPIIWKNAKGEYNASFDFEIQKGETSNPVSFIKSAKFNLNASRPMLEYAITQFQLIKQHQFYTSNDNNFIVAQNTTKDMITHFQNIKKQFLENKEARDQFKHSVPLPAIMTLALINIDDTKLTSDINYKDGSIIINGGKPKSLDEFIADPLD